MSNYNFTEEEINKILLSSPMVLPQSPSEYGLKGNNIKTYFYDFIRKLMLLLNEHFILIKKDKEESILDHEGNETSHSDIRQILQNLMDKDVELGNMISGHYNEVVSTNNEIKQKIKDDISLHSTDENAHKNIRTDILSVKQIAENALNSAQGKTRVYPVKNADEMIDKLNDTINIGDRFVLSDKNVPDFTLFEKNSTEKDVITITKEQVSLKAVEFIPGERYLYEGYLLVASESGIDTSLLVKTKDFELLELIVNELGSDLENYANEIEAKLQEKENVRKAVWDSSENVTLQNNTEYNLGLRTKVNLILPSEVPTDFGCIVNFRTGTSGATFSCDGVLMTQNDCYKGILTPCKNRIYEISIKNVDGVLIGKVGICDYTV